MFGIGADAGAHHIGIAGYGGARAGAKEPKCSISTPRPKTTLGATRVPARQVHMWISISEGGTTPADLGCPNLECYA